MDLLGTGVRKASESVTLRGDLSQDTVTLASQQKTPQAEGTASAIARGQGEA